jgi:hypothetical protein
VASFVRLATKVPHQVDLTWYFHGF